MGNWVPPKKLPDRGIDLVYRFRPIVTQVVLCHSTPSKFFVAGIDDINYELPFVNYKVLEVPGIAVHIKKL